MFVKWHSGKVAIKSPSPTKAGSQDEAYLKAHEIAPPARFHRTSGQGTVVVVVVKTVPNFASLVHSPIKALKKCTPPQCAGMESEVR